MYSQMETTEIGDEVQKDGMQYAIFFFFRAKIGQIEISIYIMYTSIR